MTTSPGTPVTNLIATLKATGSDVGHRCLEERSPSENVDLPLNDMTTLRFFYNVGLNYFRSFASVPPPPLQTPPVSSAGELHHTSCSKQGQGQLCCHEPALTTDNLQTSSPVAYSDVRTASPVIPTSAHKAYQTKISKGKNCEVIAFERTQRQTDSITSTATENGPHDWLKATEHGVKSSKIWTPVRGTKCDVQSTTDGQMNDSETDEEKAAKRKQNSSPRSPDSGWSSESDASSERSSISGSGKSEVDSGKATLTADEQNRQYDSTDDSEDRVVEFGMTTMSLMDRKLETSASTCDRQPTQHLHKIAANMPVDCYQSNAEADGNSVDKKSILSESFAAVDATSEDRRSQEERNGEELREDDLPLLLLHDHKHQVQSFPGSTQTMPVTKSVNASTTSATRHIRSMKPIPARFRRLLDAEVQRVAAVRQRVEGVPLFACSAPPPPPPLAAAAAAAQSPLMTEPYVVVCGESPMTSYATAANVSEHCGGLSQQQQPQQLTTLVTGNGFALPPYFNNSTMQSAVHIDSTALQSAMQFGSSAVSEINHSNAFTATSVHYQPMHYQLNGVEYRLQSNDCESNSTCPGGSYWSNCTIPSANSQLYQSNVFYAGVPATAQQPLPAYVIHSEGDLLPAASMALQVAVSPTQNRSLRPDQVSG